MELRKTCVHRYSGHAMPPVVTLFVKYPHPGKVNTRLIPALGEQGAADLHRTLTQRTLATALASGLPVEVRTAGASHADFADWLGTVPLVPQGEGDLGDRLARVAVPAILLGADVPDLAPHHLTLAAEALEHVPAAIGPAQDGGYYLLAMRDPMPFLFTDMPWGTDIVRAETCRRLDARGIAFRLLETLADCDRPEDLSRWPDLAP